jgi:hypothetical protein
MGRVDLSASKPDRTAWLMLLAALLAVAMVKHNDPWRICS